MRLVTSEKAVKLIEIENVLVLEVDRRMKKQEIIKEFEEMFKDKIDSINTLIRKNKKYVYLKLNKSNPAIDIATKMGMI